uniref:Putative secreted protein n=1 Tax=Anopheles darlingi TaxID=43151 RepID=A0A2M4DPP6_ANODA
MHLPSSQSNRPRWLLRMLMVVVGVSLLRWRRHHRPPDQEPVVSGPASSAVSSSPSLRHFSYRKRFD